MRRLPLALLICLAAPSAAGAAVPFNAGTGTDPRVAVSPDGTGHVAFSVAGSPDTVDYCRVPKGGSACDATHTLAYPGPGDHQGRATQVFAPAAGKVVVVSGCWSCAAGSIKERVMRWTSTDNGASFGAADELTVPGNTGAGFNVRDGDGLLLDGGGLFVGIGGDRLAALPTAGEQHVIHSNFGTNYGPEVDRLAATNRLVSAVNDLDNITYAVYNGPNLTAAAINTQANWTGPLPLSAPEGDNSESGVAGGPSGLYMHYRYFGAGNSRVGVRRFDDASATFGPPVYVDGENPVDDNSLDYPEAFQDPSGRLHVVWRTLHDAGRLRYTVSDPSGNAFSVPATLAARETFLDPEVAAAADGSGFAVWSGIGESLIRVVTIDPQVEPAPDPGPGPGPGTPTPVGFPADPADGASAKASRRKVKVAVKGKLVVPAGTTCAGKVRITVKRGKKRIARKTTAVRPDCSYRKRIKIKRKKVKRARKLGVIMQFLPAEGSGLAPSRTSFKIRIRR